MKEISIIMENILNTEVSLFDDIFNIKDYEKVGTLSDEVFFYVVSEVIRGLEDEDRLIEKLKNSNDKEGALIFALSMENKLGIPLFGLSISDSISYSIKRLATKSKEMLFEYFMKIRLDDLELTDEERKVFNEVNKKGMKFNKYARNTFYYVFLSNLEGEIEKSTEASERNPLINYKYNTIFFESFYEKELMKAKFDIRKVDKSKIEGLNELNKMNIEKFRDQTTPVAIELALEAIKNLKNKNYLERLKNNKALLKCYILYLKTALNLMHLIGMEVFKGIMESEIKTIPSVLDFQDQINEILELVEKIIKERKEETGFQFYN